MLRPCPQCGTRNHIYAEVCPCGFQLLGRGEPSAVKLQPEPEPATAAAPPDAPREPLPTKSPESTIQPSPLPPPPPIFPNTREEMEKQKVIKALIAEESDARKAADGALTLPAKKYLALVSLLIVVGALLIATVGLPKFIQSSAEVKTDETKPSSLADAASAADARKAAAINPNDKNTVEGKVVDVASGDTITVANANNQEYQIRLAGIDAPELEQAFGQESKRNLFMQISGKTVQVNLQKPGEDGITVGRVIINGKNASLEQLKAGLAWHKENAVFEQAENDSYAYNETIAKRNNLGLWSEANPVAPWDYRQSKAGFNQSENPAIAADTTGGRERTETAPAPKMKTAIVQEEGNQTESQAALAETPPAPAYPNAVVPADNSRRQQTTRENATIAPAAYDHKTTFTSLTATAKCKDGTMSFSATRSGSCARHGGVAEWLNGSTAPAKTNSPARKYTLGARGGCFYLNDSGRKVYVDRELCGN